MAITDSTIQVFTSQELADEEWRPISNFPSYDVSNLGRVRSWHRPAKEKIGKTPLPHIKNQCLSNSGYPRVRLVSNGKAIHVAVHHLVLEAFIGPCPSNMETCHFDGNRLNNRLTNLRWDTRQANSRDTKRHGRNSCGERNGLSVLTEQQVLQIRYRFANGEKASNLGREFSIQRQTITTICRGGLWKHIGGPIHKAGSLGLWRSRTCTKLTEDDVHIIRDLYSQGESIHSLSVKYNVGQGTIQAVIAKRTWKDI